MRVGEARCSRKAADPTGPRDPSLTVEVVRDAGGFAALEDEWGRLYDGSPAATPFQSWGWLYSWWEHRGLSGGRGLRLVLARDPGGELVGLAPLMVERGPLRIGRLLFVGTGATDSLDVLIREGWESEVPGALAGALRGMGGWSAADLQELRPGAAAWGVFDRWDGPKARLAQSSCPVVEVRPWEDAVRSLKKNHRSDARRALRRAEEEDVRVGLAGPEEAGEAARRLVALHREWWGEKGISRDHLTAEFEAHISSAARRLTRAGLGGIYETRRGGEVILSNFALFGREAAFGYMLGTSKEVFANWSYSPLFLKNMLEAANERGLVWVDLLRGEERYKDRWSTSAIHSERAILGLRVPPVAACVAYYSLRDAAKRYVGSPRTPRTLEKVVKWLKGVRRG